jgi:hypothetical protein
MVLRRHRVDRRRRLVLLPLARRPRQLRASASRIQRRIVKSLLATRDRDVDSPCAARNQQAGL